MFYDRFLELCDKKRVKPTNACIEAGLSRGLAAKWKSTGTEKPSADALEKLSSYFNMSIDEILKKEKAPAEAEALVNGDPELTEYLEELRTRDEMRMLFSITKGATKEDVMRTVAIIEALRREEEGR